MKILSRASVVAVACCILLFGSALCYGANWTLYYIDGINKYYYDKSGVVTPRTGIRQVLIKKTILDDPGGQITRLEMSCNYRTFRILTNKVDPATGEYIPEGPAAGGYKWTWFPLEAPAKALYENICE